MSHRLQVLVPKEMDALLRKAAKRARVSKGAWVRRALERALRSDRAAPSDVDKLAALCAPTADIEDMLAEIEKGRR